MDQFENKEDYLLSLFEVCEILGKSSRTITRYVHKHVLHPRGIKSRQGTLEYRFSKAEVEVLKQREDRLRQYNYMTQNETLTRAPEASFASLNYPPVISRQNPFVIPGISFGGSGNVPVEPRPTEPSSRFVPFDASQTTDEKKPAVNKPEVENNSRLKPLDNAVQYHNNDEIISLLKETTGMLRDQLKAKDDQIKNLDDKIGQLIERNRETNILLKGLQDKMGLLEKPKTSDRTRNERADRNQKNQPSQTQEKNPPSMTLSVESIISDQIKEKEAFSTAENDISDKQASVALEPLVPIAYPAPLAADKSDKFESPQKKGLFGKIFR